MKQDELFYRMIFKRKSFHLFRNTGDEPITEDELQKIQETYGGFEPLVPDIKTQIRIVSNDETTCKRGQEYCILLYSEKKDNYLQNIGYLGEQLDLFLTSLNIGALWFGIGKVEEKSYNGLDYVIMIAIKKVPEDKFRKDMYKSKRKDLSEIWLGDFYKSIGDVARFTPSSCNTQPWKVECTEDELKVYRYKKPGKRGIMPIDKVTHYNRIDIGIYLLFLELCLKQERITFTRTLHTDSTESNEAELILTATYKLTCPEQM